MPPPSNKTLPSVKGWKHHTHGNLVYKHVSKRSSSFINCLGVDPYDNFQQCKASKWSSSARSAPNTRKGFSATESAHHSNVTSDSTQFQMVFETASSVSAFKSQLESPSMWCLPITPNQGIFIPNTASRAKHMHAVAPTGQFLCDLTRCPTSRCIRHPLAVPIFRQATLGA